MDSVNTRPTVLRFIRTFETPFLRESDCQEPEFRGRANAKITQQFEEMGMRPGSGSPIRTNTQRLSYFGGSDCVNKFFHCLTILELPSLAKEGGERSEPGGWFLKKIRAAVRLFPTSIALSAILFFLPPLYEIDTLGPANFLAKTVFRILRVPFRSKNRPPKAALLG
jgi:hypothetical protein